MPKQQYSIPGIDIRFESISIESTVDLLLSIVSLSPIVIREYNIDTCTRVFIGNILLSRVQINSDTTEYPDCKVLLKT